MPVRMHVPEIPIKHRNYFRYKVGIHHIARVLQGQLHLVQPPPRLQARVPTQAIVLKALALDKHGSTRIGNGS